MVHAQHHDEDPIESGIRDHAENADDQRSANVMNGVEAVGHDLDRPVARQSDGETNQRRRHLHRIIGLEATPLVNQTNDRLSQDDESYRRRDTEKQDQPDGVGESVPEPSLVTAGHGTAQCRQRDYRDRDADEPDGKPKLVVNVGTGFLSSQVIGALVASTNKHTTAGGTMILCNLSEQTRTILSLCKLEPLFKILPDEAAAVHKLQAR